MSVQNKIANITRRDTFLFFLIGHRVTIHPSLAARKTRFLLRYLPTATKFGTPVQTAPARLQPRQRGRRAFLFSTAEHRGRIISASFPTSYAALSHGGSRGSPANFGIKITGACRIILLCEQSCRPRTHRAL